MYHTVSVRQPKHYSHVRKVFVLKGVLSQLFDDYETADLIQITKCNYLLDYRVVFSESDVFVKAISFQFNFIPKLCDGEQDRCVALIF